MRKPLVAGNWKMHGSSSQAKILVEGIRQGAPTLSAVEIALFPAFTYLHQVHDLLRHTSIMLGAQNFYLGAQGAFTGEISAPMLLDSGCEYVLIGHSERRHHFHEDLPLVAAKFQAAVEAGLKPILCVGETLTEREQGVTEAVIHGQLDSVLQLVGIQAFRHAVLAYEPVWAIGTGLTATPAQAQEVHAFIRGQLAKNQVDIANTIRILYGGSLKPENAASLFAMADIDGGLVGGASLDAQGFLTICTAASQKRAVTV